MASLRSLVCGLAALIVMSAALPSLAEPQLYAATVRSRTGPGDDAAGNLYLVDPSDASFRSVGPLRLQGRSIGITGLAVHPKTGVLYGVTAGSSPAYRNSLVTIDPATAEASMVGEMRVAGS